MGRKLGKKFNGKIKACADDHNMSQKEKDGRIFIIRHVKWKKTSACF